jgi:UDP-N-acetylmuramoyl-tripeptide--D-alanyl-D-alanine ligase
LRFDQLAAMTGGTLYNSGVAARSFTGVSIDSRTIAAGQLFVAIPGERFDGHDFIPAAIQRGAAGLLVETNYPQLYQIRGDVPVVAVPDSHQAMISLAHQYRRQSATKIIGITGSNGKTTTKEFTFALAQAVEQHVYRSPGNLNNLFGMPLALFAMPPQVNLAIMEMGISTPGEMTRLTRLVRPDIVAITNVGASHLQFLNSVENVARAKLEIVTASEQNVPVIINADDRILYDQARKVREDLITFAIDAPARYQPEWIDHNANGTTLVNIDGKAFMIRLPGRHQVYNLLAAWALLRTLGYDFQNVDTPSIELSTAPMRGQTIEIDGMRIVADCYNANPESVKAGLEAFFSLRPGMRQVLILGDMRELGDQAVPLHEQVGRALAAYDFHRALMVGPNMRHAISAAVSEGVSPTRFEHYDTAEQCAADIRNIIKDGDHIFIKASRGTGLDKVLKSIAPEENR